MSFIDEARIQVKAGDGGKGCESYYSDKKTRYPRPDGGDGGPGGEVIVVADRNLQTLLDYKFNRHHQAQRGGNASSKGKTGRTGVDCTLRVPVGTLIFDLENNLLIRDLNFDGQSVVVARGGKGGIGNMHRKATMPPTLGEVREIRFELKVIADVGLIGFPNAGKSTIISNISKVKSKIATYPFTTKQPILGIVYDDDFHFVVADLPGLIEGAHQGRGLGQKFLKHAERTKILVHVVDMAGSEDRDPLEDFEKIIHELEAYSEHLAGKTRIVVANKMDLLAAAKNLERFKRKYKQKIFPVSALEGKGLGKLVEFLHKTLIDVNSN